MHDIINTIWWVVYDLSLIEIISVTSVSSLQAPSQLMFTSISFQEATTVLIFFLFCYCHKFILTPLELHINRTTRMYSVVLGFFSAQCFWEAFMLLYVSVGVYHYYYYCWVLFHCMSNTMVYPFWAASSFLPLPFNSRNNISHHCLPSVLNIIQGNLRFWAFLWLISWLRH